MRIFLKLTIYGVIFIVVLSLLWTPLVGESIFESLSRSSESAEGAN